MHLVPRMATALVFFIYMSNEGLDQVDAQLADKQSGAQILCGPALSNALTLVCNGVFNGYNKKSRETTTGRIEDWSVNDQDNFAIYPFRSRRHALALTSSNYFRRRTRGIADECCRKACTVGEIRNYCGR